MAEIENDPLIALEGPPFYPFGPWCKEIERECSWKYSDFSSWLEDASQIHLMVWAQGEDSDPRIEVTAFAWDTSASSVDLGSWLEKSFEDSLGAGPEFERVALEKLRAVIDRLIVAREREIEGSVADLDK